MRLLAGIFAFLVHGCHCYASLPPTTLRGQNDTTAPTTFNYQVPFSQSTRTAGTSALIETGNMNLLPNPGFEHTTFNTGWSASGGTVVAETVAPLLGAKSLSWTPTASSQTLTGPNINAPVGSRRRNGEASCLLKNEDAVSRNITMRVVAGGPTLVTQTVTLNDADFPASRVTLNFIIPDGISAQIVFESSGSGGPILIDDCYFGEARNIYDASLVGPWINAGALTITSTGTAPTKGTTTVDRFLWRRVGGGIEFDIRFNQSTAGTNGTGAYRIAIPASIGCTIDTALTGTYTGTDATANLPVVGSGLHALSPSNSIWAKTFVVSETQLALVASASTSTNATHIAGGNTGPGAAPWWALASANLTYQHNGRVPCAGWAATSVVRLDQTNYDWTAYTPTFTALGTATNVSCFHRRQGANLEISCRYNIGTGSASEARVSLPGSLLIDGTKLPSTRAIVGYAGTGTTYGGAVAVLAEPNVGYLNFGLSVQGGGAYAKSNGSGFSSGEVHSWTVSVPIQGWTENFSAPLITNSIATRHQGVGQMEAADVTCSAASSIISQSSAVASIGNRSSAACTLTLVSGVFSAAPWGCSVEVKGTTAGSTACNCTSATSCTITGPSAADYNAYVILFGPRQ